MNDRRSPERLLAAWFELEAPLGAPDELRDDIHGATRRIRPRPAWLARDPRQPILLWRPALNRVSRRFPIMSTYAKLAVAAVAVIAVGAIGVAVARPPGPPTSGGQNPAPSPSASAIPSPSRSRLPALTERYTSAIHGISAAYPSGWTVFPASGPWTPGSGLPSECGDDTCADHIYQRETNSPFLDFASQSLGGRSGEQWAAEVLKAPALEATCPAETEPVTIDGAPGMIATLCPNGLLTALAWVGNRGYFIVLYRIDDLDWFKEVLAAIELHPEDAIDAVPSSSP
jgi:hypothetical protein